MFAKWDGYGRVTGMLCGSEAKECLQCAFSRGVQCHGGAQMQT